MKNITGIEDGDARRILDTKNWNVEESINAYLEEKR